MSPYDAAPVATVVETQPGVWTVSDKQEVMSPKSPAAKSASEHSDTSTADLSTEQVAAASGSASSSRAGSKAGAFGADNPSVAAIIFGEVRGGPRPEYFVVKFQEHLEPALRDLASAMGERWLAAGGHTGTDANPNKVTVAPVMKAESASDVFKKVFTKGFVVECVEPIVGPPSPKILLKFRHVGPFTGSYTDEEGRVWEGQGQMLDVSGVVHIARDPATGEMGKVDVFYDHLTVIKAMTDPDFLQPGACPMSGKEGKSCPMLMSS